MSIVFYASIFSAGSAIEKARSFLLKTKKGQKFNLKYLGKNQNLIIYTNFSLSTCLE